MKMEQSKETMQEGINRLMKRVNTAGVDGPFVPMICLTGLVFQAAAVVAEEVLRDLKIGADADRTLEVARLIMERIQLVVPSQTMSNNLVLPTMPMPGGFTGGFGGRSQN